jgi:hypothetical protein
LETSKPQKSRNQGSTYFFGLRMKGPVQIMTDPDPRGPKTYGSGPPVLWSGSGSVSFWASRIRIRHYLYRSFHPQAKKVYKTLISALLWLFKDFLSLKTDANVASKNNKQKKLEKKLIFGWLAS